MASYETIKDAVRIITNEVNDGANTASRIGTALQNILDYAKENDDAVRESIGACDTALVKVGRVAKGAYNYRNIDELNNYDSVGVYVLGQATSPTHQDRRADYGVLLVSANYNSWIQQFYFGCLNPETWSGNATWTRIYTRYYVNGAWSEWKDYQPVNISGEYIIPESIDEDKLSASLQEQLYNKAEKRELNAVKQKLEAIEELLKSGVILMASE